MRALSHAFENFRDLAFTIAAIVAVFVVLMFDPLMAELMP